MLKTHQTPQVLPFASGGGYVSRRRTAGLKVAGTACFDMVKNLPAVRETGFDPWVGKIP